MEADLGRSSGAEGERSMEARTPTVLFLAGSGRSGSTLVERMLGQIPGFVNVGEVIDLFRRVYLGDELCGCGTRFSQCAFWREVGDRAFDGWNTELVAEVAGLQARVARQRYIPHHLSPRKRARFRSDAEVYRQRYVELYQAISATAGARIVVDASKWPAQAMALSRSSLDLRVIQVVRDVRGVAWSMNKRDLIRPHATIGREVMFRQGIVTAATRWTLCQAEVDAVRLTGTPVAVLSYEDLATNARSAVATVLELLSLHVDDADLSHLRRHEADLGSSHGLSGNPSRFTAGVTPLRIDEEWRDKMPRPSQALLAMIGSPHRLRGTWAGGSRRPTQPAVRGGHD